MPDTLVDESNLVTEQVQQPLPYPYQNALTRQMRNAAAQQGRPEFLSLWAGVGAWEGREGSAADILASLCPWLYARDSASHARWRRGGCREVGSGSGILPGERLGLEHARRANQETPAPLDRISTA